MPEPIRGIHHITAVASDPQRNLDFYTRVLGLRLVKLTVNFDDPGTYHFYFGDAAGRPGTILTFFPWQGIRRGRRGPGQVGTVAFRIPQAALGYWSGRLKQLGIPFVEPLERFGEAVLPLSDPDGLRLELIASGAAGTNEPFWSNSPVPAEHALSGFHHPTLLVSEIEPTAELLGTAFGMRHVQQSGRLHRFMAGEGDEAGSQVDVEVLPGEPMGTMGAGVVHHIAFRSINDADQLEWRQVLISQGLDVTTVRDRQYFHSIYFREPGQILFEIATDPPGFATDETPQTLGTGLKLPAWLEPNREEIERLLPALALPLPHNQATNER